LVFAPLDFLTNETGRNRITGKGHLRGDGKITNMRTVVELSRALRGFNAPSSTSLIENDIFPNAVCDTNTRHYAAFKANYDALNKVVPRSISKGKPRMAPKWALYDPTGTGDGIL
jgi:hypothetical protein